MTMLINSISSSVIAMTLSAHDDENYDGTRQVTRELFHSPNGHTTQWVLSPSGPARACSAEINIIIAIVCAASYQTRLVGSVSAVRG